MPPTPNARSSETLPVEMAAMSCTSGSSAPRRMTAPLPNCFSMAETASSIAFSLSAFATLCLPLGSLYACTEVMIAWQDAKGVRHRGDFGRCRERRRRRRCLLAVDAQELDVEDQGGA